MRVTIRIIIVGFFTLLLSCNSIKSVKHALLNTSPYEEYVQSLNKAGLKESKLVKEWTDAGARAMKDSIMVNTPFSETGFFQAAEPGARSYRFQVRAGQVVVISALTKSSSSVRLFADLFTREEGRWKELTHADSAVFMKVEFEKDQTCLLRIQPELLSDLWYNLTIVLQPALINPVKGATNKSIGSFYGNVRDNGARTHEGIDIFAPRGTPVIAPANGVIYEAGTNKLGGKVIWLYDAQRGHTYYFAHLDSQWVKASLNVKQGDTIGQVGNTGNAKYTAPHLHFGIYRNGSKDPLHYVQTTASIIHTIPDTTFRGLLCKVSVKEAVFYAGPSSKNTTLRKEPKETYVKQLSKSADWYRVALPDKQQAYVNQRQVKVIEKGKKLILKTNDTLWTEASEHRIPMMFLDASDVVELLSQYKEYSYVRTTSNLSGWIKLQY